MRVINVHIQFTPSAGESALSIDIPADNDSSTTTGPQDSSSESQSPHGSSKQDADTDDATSSCSDATNQREHTNPESGQ